MESCGHSLVQETADSIDEVILSQGPKDLPSLFSLLLEQKWLADLPNPPNFIVDPALTTRRLLRDAWNLKRKYLKHFKQFCGHYWQDFENERVSLSRIMIILA